MTQTDSPIIELRHVDKHYGSLHVLRDISLRVHQGEVVVIVGPSGSGKSTLCRTINRLETIDSGEILIDGVALPEEGKKLAAVRSQVGMVFQSFNLFAHMSILDNMTLAPVDVLKRDKKEARAEAMRLLERVGVADQAHKVPAQLSGGQQQRVGLARALAVDPRIMLLDEPFGAIDSITRAKLQDELLSLHRGMNKTFLFVTHDIEEAFKLGSRVIIMNEGRICQFDTPENIIRNPQGDFVRSLVDSARAKEAFWGEYL